MTVTEACFHLLSSSCRGRRGVFLTGPRAPHPHPHPSETHCRPPSVHIGLNKIQHLSLSCLSSTNRKSNIRFFTDREQPAEPRRGHGCPLHKRPSQDTEFTLLTGMDAWSRDKSERLTGPLPWLVGQGVRLELTLDSIYHGSALQRLVGGEGGRGAGPGSGNVAWLRKRTPGGQGTRPGGQGGTWGLGVSQTSVQIPALPVSR